MKIEHSRFLNKNESSEFWANLFESSNKRGYKSLDACRLYRDEIHLKIMEKYPVKINGDECPKCNNMVVLATYGGYYGSYDKYSCISKNCDFSYYPYQRGKPTEDLRRYNSIIKSHIERIAGFSIYLKHVEQVIDENKWPRIDLEYYGKSYSDHTRQSGKHNADLMEKEILNSSSGIFDDDRFLFISNPVIEYKLSGENKIKHKVPDIIIKDLDNKVLAVIEVKISDFDREKAVEQVLFYSDLIRLKYGTNYRVISETICGWKESEIFKAAAFIAKTIRNAGVNDWIGIYREMRTKYISS